MRGGVSPVCSSEQRSSDEQITQPPLIKHQCQSCCIPLDLEIRGMSSQRAVTLPSW